MTSRVAGYLPRIAGGTLPERYSSPSLVARGGMGEVYRAVDSVLGRTVAVKLLSRRYADEPEARARFRREALAAARLSSSRHVVTVFDVGEHEGRPLIVMEYVEGGSVHDRVRRGPVPREEALAWLEQAADALDRAHARGVVHRDVKPANLLLDGDSNVQVTDFGIASTTGQDTLTLPGTVLGTVGYLSPEQARGEPATTASDRYALGVVAFELLTGRRPFASETATTEALAHVSAPVPSAAALAPELPSTVDVVLRRALAKDPGQRPSSCHELVADVRTALETGASGSHELRTVVTQPQPPTRPLHRVRPPWRRFASLAAAGFAGLLALILLVSSRGDSNEPTRQRSAARKAAPTAEEQPASLTVEGAALNEAGYAKLQAGDFAAALPLLRNAVLALRGSGVLDEAYASYNLAFARFALGGCDGVVGLLDRSERIQGYRPEIQELRARWQERCAAPVTEDEDGDSSEPGKGKGHGRRKGR